MKRRQATIDAMLSSIPGHRRSLTASHKIILGVAHDHAILCCPACGNAHLHRRDVLKNPDRVILMFWCEGCRNQPELTIEQHQAQTRLVWHY